MATTSTVYPAQDGARSASRQPYTKAVSGNSYKPYGGAILHGGTLSSTSPITKTTTLMANAGEKDIVVGSQPYVSSEGGVQKAASARNFATIGQMIIPRYTTTLGGVASTALSTNAGWPLTKQSIPRNVKDYLAKDASIAYSYRTGAHTTLTGLAAVTTYVQKDGTTAATDEASVPSAGTPGDFRTNLAAMCQPNLIIVQKPTSKG